MKYKWFSFLSKLAFICNVLFAGCIAMRYTSIQLPQFLTGFMIIAGWLCSPIINCITIFGLILFSLKGIRKIVPLWINATNLFFLFFQIFYFLLISNG